jgi:hypothetical protein
MYAILATSVLVFALAMWNPKFMQSASPVIAPGAQGMVSPMLLALATLLIGAGAMYFMGHDVLSLQGASPVVVAALAVFALGWSSPSWMGRLPGGAATMYGLAVLVAGGATGLLMGSQKSMYGMY